MRDTYILFETDDPFQFPIKEYDKIVQIHLEHGVSYHSLCIRLKRESIIELNNGYSIEKIEWSSEDDE